jgi:UDP-2,4-diacetamido-2,4,6-trideoxy-beta-L-altropyranose hydrolase
MTSVNDPALRALNGAGLVVRADAGPTTGAGHVMRCLALMQAWRARGGKVWFATAACPDRLVNRVQAEALARVERITSQQAGLSDADETAAIAERLGAQWIVVDGYDFQAGYVRRMQARGARVLLLDDLGQRSTTGAAILLNQNLHAAAALYETENPSTQRLIGLDYFLLRSEFWPWRGWVRALSAQARSIGIALGAADPTDQTRRLIRALDSESFAGINFEVVVGAANLRRDEICAEASSAKGQFRVHVDIVDMASFLASIDMLISSAGVTAWEAAFLSTPMLLATVGPQERMLAQSLAAANACICLGPLESVTDAAIASRVIALAKDHSARAALASGCAGLIDGRGPERVIDAMLRQQALVHVEVTP